MDDTYSRCTGTDGTSCRSGTNDRTRPETIRARTVVAIRPHDPDPASVAAVTPATVVGAGQGRRAPGPTLPGRAQGRRRGPRASWGHLLLRVRYAPPRSNWRSITAQTGAQAFTDPARRPGDRCDGRHCHRATPPRPSPWPRSSSISTSSWPVSRLRRTSDRRTVWHLSPAASPLPERQPQSIVSSPERAHERQRQVDRDLLPASAPVDDPHLEPLRLASGPGPRRPRGRGARPAAAEAMESALPRTCGSGAGHRLLDDREVVLAASPRDRPRPCPRGPGLP